MKKIRLIVLLSISFITLAGCKSVDSVVSSANTDIIGSWEGCDGRVVTFYKDERGEIKGRYTQLGGLGKYNFSLNEVGFRLSRKSPGVYVGQVKWRNTIGKETWKDETITVENNILKTTSSDDCSTELAKVE